VKHALETYGWDAWFAERFAPYAERGHEPARVTVEHRSQYELYGRQGPMAASLAGRLRHHAADRADLPAVGDWVAVAPRAGGDATIHGVVPRRSSFTRRAAGKHAVAQVAAANIDVVFLVTSCNADFNPRRLERYLAVGYESGATPVVVLSKADLASAAARDAFVAGARATAAGAPVVVTSATTGEGVEEVRRFLRGHRTGALLGSSGVGKSTLINRLLGEERFGTAAIRAHDDRGRHTTTRRELVVLPGGGLLIDTPGMREMQLYEGDEGLLTAFDDVLALAAGCAFADCRHGPEPGCAVMAAVRDGLLAPERLESYRKLAGELEHHRRTIDKRADAAAKRKAKVATKALRTHLKNKRG
jgi:ribosome biogenesis GTPase